jgi:hypothetical protein
VLVAVHGPPEPRLGPIAGLGPLAGATAAVTPEPGRPGASAPSSRDVGDLATVHNFSMPLSLSPSPVSASAGEYGERPSRNNGGERSAGCSRSCRYTYGFREIVSQIVEYLSLNVQPYLFFFEHEQTGPSANRLLSRAQTAEGIEPGYRPWLGERT